MSQFISRRSALIAFACFALASGAWLNAQTAAKKPQVTVYKSPTCGCCSNWVEHMKAAGFDVKAMNVDDIDQVKKTYGVPASGSSCHTALVNGYVVEGHVPADAVQKMLREKPAIAGIAVPGMPAGSPGMEVPGGRKDPYAIMSFDKKGTVAVYERR
jgi:hypothetical protein